MKSRVIKTVLLASCFVWAGSAMAAKPVGITPSVMEAKVQHGGQDLAEPLLL